MMSSRNMLETKFGRLSTFALLYLTEGIPWGFTSIAIVTQMRSENLSPRVIGAFLASLSTPYALKWTLGPVVDVVYSDRLGRRRAWIVGAQILMVGMLMLAMSVDFSTHLRLFTFLIFLHNVFAATQDVAIDALACNVLKDEERGSANGLMYGASYLGTAIGGAGMLYLADYLGESAVSGSIPWKLVAWTGLTPFESTVLVIAAMICLITLTVSMRLKEQPTEKTTADDGPALDRVWSEIRSYSIDAARAMLGNRGAFVGMIVALLPMGALALSMQMQTALAVEFGFSRTKIADLTFKSGMIAAAFCVIGGLISDRFGRRRMLALYLLAMSGPTIYLAVVMQRYGWIMPIDVKAADKPIPPTALVDAFWYAVLVYSAFAGLMGGVRLALFMDITNPKVAATQFTAYMAMLNLVIAYTALWQGLSIELLGYPRTLWIDAGLGLLCILLLPWVAKPASAGSS